MLEREKRPTGLLTATEELRQLIIDNPAIPLLVFAGESCNSGSWTYESCGSCHAALGKFLDCVQEVNEERIYTDKDEFQEALEGCYPDFDGSDQEFEQFIEDRVMEYEPYWKPCIILYVDN